MRSATILIALAVLTGCGSPRPVEPADQALGVLEDLKAWDTDGLWAAMSDEERKATGFSSESFSVFIDRFVRPRMSEFRAEGEPKVEQLDKGSSLAIEQSYSHPDGRTAGLAVQSFVTDAGPRVFPLSLFLTTWAGLGGRPKSDQSFSAAWESYAEDADELKSLLGPLGVKGLVLNEADGDRAVTWDEWAAACSKRAATMRAAKAEPAKIER